MLETKDLRLDKAKYEDWEAMYRNVWSHWESARYMTWTLTQSEEEARERILRTIEFQKDHDTYLVYEKATGEAIGFAGVEQMNPPHICQETGICLGPAYVGKGYGRQIVQCLLEYCKARYNATEFVYSTREVNEASKALARSFGFQPFTHIYKNDTRDGHQYKVLKFKRFI